MPLYAVKRGTDGQRVSARSVRARWPLQDDEFHAEIAEDADFSKLRLGPRNTIRQATTEELSAEADQADAVALRREALAALEEHLLEQAQSDDTMPQPVRDKVSAYLAKTRGGMSG